MPLETFLLYLATWTLVAISPGPAVLFSMSQAARHGMRGAAAGTAGILLGHVIVFGAVALGLAALIASYSGAVTGIRIVGALYLMYLGAKMLFTRARPAELPLAVAAPPRHGGLVLQGLGVQLTNPKLLLFVLALLPQFISPGYPLPLQLAIMLAVTVVIDGVALLAYAKLASHGARALKGSHALAWLERAFGGALICFGLNLLTARK